MNEQPQRPTPAPLQRPVDMELLRLVRAANERPIAPPAPWQDSPFWRTA